MLSRAKCIKNNIKLASSIFHSDIKSGRYKIRKPSLHFKVFLLISLILAIFITQLSVPSLPSKYSPKVGLFVNGSYCPGDRASVFILPGDVLTVEIKALDIEAALDQRYVARVKSEDIEIVDNWANRFEITAPAAAGIYPVVFYRTGMTGDFSYPLSKILNVVVMKRSSEIDGDKLNGYRIGKYPSKAMNGLENYVPPIGFVEVTEDNEDTFLSEHFRLKDFECKQAGSYPKYIAIQSRLLFKLEYLVEALNLNGYRCSSLNVMSGYRTPVYNFAIGNKTRYSRHLYGDAADVFVDENPKDGVMDDLNADGKINHKDVKILQDIINEMDRSQDFEEFVGGSSTYSWSKNHGPFVHLDARGYKARW